MIYATIARAIRKPIPSEKSDLLDCVGRQMLDFDVHHATHLASQAAFNQWHSDALNAIMAVPFHWEDARGGHHAACSFGAAQKFLNLGLKDWWAVSPNGANAAIAVDRLHGPFDQLVYACSSRFCGPLSSMRTAQSGRQSFVYNLSLHDYQKYQDQLEELGRRLTAGMVVRFGAGVAGMGPLVARMAPLNRIETEQLLWGWV